MNYQPLIEKLESEIEQEYQTFLADFEIIKKKQNQLIGDYQEELEQKKLSRLRKQLEIK